uniref:SNTX thioredoxin-like domain-containing protein n=1 Tax=Astyanax mexicanus TaxID=7994 RepID=A0A8B9HNX5_ASTMX
MYNIIKEFLVSITLWDKASLTQDLDVRRQPNTDLKFSASDSLSDQASLLDVSASLKASFLGGLVEVGGSAKYLNDKKSSANQSRVTMHYGQTTKFEQLTMTQLGKITYPRVFDDKTATHVVTAVLYGSQVFMVFDRTTADNEDKQEVEGTLHVMVKKIPSFSIEGDGALKMNEKEKKVSNPTTYMEALQLYKKLPTLLKQRENDAVPVSVWLYPLTQLNDGAAKMEREISTSLVSKIENVLQELEDAKKKYGAMDRSNAANRFQDVRKRLKIFHNVFTEYEVMFKKALSRILPAIRSGEATQTKLSDILNIHSRSPFVANKLEEWLENAQGEINLLSSYTAELSGIPVLPSSVQVNSVVFDPRVDTVVCFSFTSLKYEDPYLSSLTKYLAADEFEMLTPVPISIDQGSPAWFNNPDFSEKMKENVLLFKSFADANKGKTEQIRFVIAPVSDSSNPGASICLYRNGQMKDNNFQPVSKPPKPSVNIQNRDVILKLQKSPTGETIRYRVEYRATQPGDSGADGKNWEFTETTDAQETFTLTGLNLDWSMGSLFTDVQTKIGTGSSRWSLSTIQSEVLNQINNIVSIIIYSGQYTVYGILLSWQQKTQMHH